MKPVIVDDSLTRAFTVKYTIYFLAGVAAAFAVPPSISEVTSRAYVVFWVLGLAATAGASAVFSLKDKWQRREMISTGLLLCFLASYTIALVATMFGSENPGTRLVLAVFTTSFLVFPFWRARYLYRRLRVTNA